MKGFSSQAEMVRLDPEDNRESLAVLRYLREIAIMKVWKSDCEG